MFSKAGVQLIFLIVCFWIIGAAAQQPKTTANPGSVQGVVLDSEGQPLARATVYGYAEENYKETAHTQTDSDGRFTLKGLPVGITYLDAFKESDNYPYNFFAFFRSPGQNTPVIVRVKADQPTTDVVIQLGQRAARLELEIADEDEKPLGAELVFTRLDQPGDYSRGGSVDGKVSMLIPPVPFRLMVDMDGYKPWHYGGDKWQGKEGVLSLKSGEVLNLIIRLQKNN